MADFKVLHSMLSYGTMKVPAFTFKRIATMLLPSGFQSDMNAPTARFSDISLPVEQVSYDIHNKNALFCHLARLFSRLPILAVGSHPLQLLLILRVGVFLLRVGHVGRGIGGARDPALLLGQGHRGRSRLLA